MQSVRQIERLNQTELDKVIPSNASWHTDYRDTAYLYIGGLPFELSEGDILTIFSQYGNPVHINLVRDQETGKSRGFCFLKYEDQRSCDLAVDNLSGAGVMGRVISVDHTRYKKKEGEIEGIGDEEVEEEADATDKEGDDRRKRRRTESASESEEERPLLKEEIELQKLLKDHDEDDPMKAYLVKEKREEVAEALKGLVKHKSKDKGRSRDDREHRHRHHRSRKHGDEEDGDRERRHRSRRDDEDGHRSHRSHRSRRERSPDLGREDEKRSHKSSRRRSRTPDADKDDDRPKHRSRREDSHSEDERPRRRRERDEDTRRSKDDRSVSREPYRRP